MENRDEILKKILESIKILEEVKNTQYHSNYKDCEFLKEIFKTLEI